MSNALVTPAWLNEPEYYQRCAKWARHHRPIAERAGWDMIVLDNASRTHSIPAAYGPHATHIRFKQEYRRTGLLEYPYAWRALYTLGHILNDWEYDRVVFVESDLFVLSQRLVDWASEQTGLVGLYTHKYGFPESAFMVLTKCEQYDEFVRAVPWQERTGIVLEQAIPWTHVERGFVGDRYEDGPPPPEAEFAAQLGLQYPVEFRRVVAA